MYNKQTLDTYKKNIILCYYHQMRLVKFEEWKRFRIIIHQDKRIKTIELRLS
jgi:hypothetical protein